MEDQQKMISKKIEELHMMQTSIQDERAEEMNPRSPTPS